MTRFKLLFLVVVLFFVNFNQTNAQISDKRLCVDAECSVPISEAKTLLRYSAPDSRLISFAPNADVIIYSKSAGSKLDLWGGVINGKRGYFPKNYVRETKILKKPLLLVDTQPTTNQTDDTVPFEQKIVAPNPVQEPFEVVDGTTIHLNADDINPSSTETPIQSTAIPASTDETEALKSEESKSKESEPELKEGSDLLATFTNWISDPAPEEEPKEETKTIVESVPIVEEPLLDAAVTPEAPEDEENPVSDQLPALEASSLEQIDLNNQTEYLQKDEDSSVVSNLPESSSLEQVNLVNETVPAEEGPNLAPEPILPSEEAAPTQDDPINSLSESKEKEQAGEEPILKTEPVEATLSVPETLEKDDALVLEDKEATTEVPLDFDPYNRQQMEESLESTTANPQIPQVVPTLPPLGLFNNQKQDPISSQEEIANEPEIIIQDEPIQPKVEDIDIKEPSEPEVLIKEPETIIQDEPIQPQVEDVEIVEIKEPSEPEVLINEVKDVEIEEASQSEVPIVQEDDKSSEIVNENNLPSYLSGVLSIFASRNNEENSEVEHVDGDHLLSKQNVVASDAPTCDTQTPKMDVFATFNSDIFLYLATTAISVLIFLFGYIAFDKSKREGPLVAKINNLEKELLVTLKENENFQNNCGDETVSNETSVENVRFELAESERIRTGLEEQVQSLEKELENSTEVGMELNRMLTEILSAESGSEGLRANVEALQGQLVEQQATINSMQESLAITANEKYELGQQLELGARKIVGLQAELDKLLENVLNMEEEKQKREVVLNAEIENYKKKYQDIYNKYVLKEQELNGELNVAKDELAKVQRALNLKTEEHESLLGTLDELKGLKKGDVAKLLEANSIRAELKLLNDENKKLLALLQAEKSAKDLYEKQMKNANDECEVYRVKYDEADKVRMEAETKLEVLSTYFKDKEAQLLKEIAKHESMWMEKQGEATSTTERIKFMQEQLKNYKDQTESLKQEIISQEVELKSQISVLEKKVHENWVSARQAERKLEDSKQEATQLRHRLTLRERSLQEEKEHRLFSPIEQNGDISLISPLDSPASPSIMYANRSHLTKSPPGLPFLPPPPGAPFMPPPLHHHGVPPFMPPPPALFPGDHRPPPLGRMSSPPTINSRYSPSSRGAYSPYDRRSSSPSDSEYGMSPPQRRGFSPFRGREREYTRGGPPPPPIGRSNGRKGVSSGGSGHSNESLDNNNSRHSNSKV